MSNTVGKGERTSGRKNDGEDVGERGRKGLERVSEDTGGQLQDGVAACGR